MEFIRKGLTQGGQSNRSQGWTLQFYGEFTSRLETHYSEKILVKGILHNMEPFPNDWRSTISTQGGFAICDLPLDLAWIPDCGLSTNLQFIF